MAIAAKVSNSFALRGGRPDEPCGASAVGRPAAGIDWFHWFSLCRRCAMNRKTLGWGMAVVVLAIAFGMLGLRPRTEAQQAAPAAATTAGPRYTVVDSDASNLTVVDNGTNMLYFYTEDPGKEVGEELHLRGSVDLNQVGKPVISPRAAK
jgi:hypothetical protein